MKFKKEWLQDLVFDDTNEGAKIVQNRITRHRRWSIDHTIVFEKDGKFYQSSYSVGATESQDESPYEYNDDEIECPEVIPVQEMVTVYKLV